MALSTLIHTCGLLLALLLGDAPAGEAQRTYQAAPCPVAPSIDGIERPGEWDAGKGYAIELQTTSAQGEARPTRRCTLRVMNSTEHLYLAFRVPDAARDLQLSPLVADVVVLAFCRGDTLVAGDDRRVCLPGLYADKHVVSAGVDADDSQRDGNAAMRWTDDDGGKYFVEWQIPLNAGDQHDIAVAPGDALRFNLVFADRFSPSAEETVLGGLFGPQMDDAATWGWLSLAAAEGPAAPPPAPSWLVELFPHTAPPDRGHHRLRRLEANEYDVDGKLAGTVTVELVYPGLDGNDTTGRARIFLPSELRHEPHGRVPLVHNAGYEIDAAGAADLVAQGYAVSTVHAHPLNPLGRGVNLDRAILHAVRQLSCIDPLRVSIQGGSAGGWMTLMLAADSFPLVWAAPDVPPVHWGYNADYIAKHELMASPLEGSTTARLPVLLAVTPIVHQSQVLYGMPFDSPTFLAVSPLAHLDTITVPTLVTFSTADMLVPIDQVSEQLVQPCDPNLFPKGFSTALSDRFPPANGARTLLAALPPERYELFRTPAADQPAPNVAGAGESRSLVLPFSRDKTWSIVVLDEGPVEPQVGHFKYAWSFDRGPFRQWAEQRGVMPDQLTLPKLERLMKRIGGHAWCPFQIRPGGAGDVLAANQLDYPAAERTDVLLGLTSFASNDACAERFAQLYAQLPVEWKVLGARLGDGTAAGTRAALQELSAEAR